MPLLTVKFLKQMDRLQIRSRHVFRGKFKGERRSLNRGASVEFADYRVYELGDDLRYIDWNIYARLDRLFIKLFTAEEDLPVFIWIDHSKSMDFGEPTKLEYAKQIAAALGYIGLTSLDRVSIYALADQLTPVVPLTYGKAQFSKLSQGVEEIVARGETHLTACAKRFVTHTRESGVMVIISDFLDMNGYEVGIKQLLSRNFDLTLIHLLSDNEMHPRLSGELQLTDAETGQSKEITVNEQALASYARRFNAFCDGLRRFCLNRGVTYIRINNRIPIEQFILKDLRRSGVIH
ncbi:MAG: DUF58 domain-containing protein [Candidatus Poribacteria bacterium]|nr:DUF58 domain-containing protein [Candidatus Poribacteria bacterium]